MGDAEFDNSNTIAADSIDLDLAMAKEAYENFDEKTERMYELKDYLIEKLSAIDGVKINSKKGRAGAPHIVNVSFVGVRSEVMLHELESHQDRKSTRLNSSHT